MSFMLEGPDGPVTVPTTFEEGAFQAQLSDTDDPAVFTVDDNKLVLLNPTTFGIDRIVLGRHAVEDRSLNPKRVLFLPEEQSLGDVRLEMDNGRGRVLFSSIFFLSLFTAWFSGANW